MRRLWEAAEFLAPGINVQDDLQQRSARTAARSCSPSTNYCHRAERSTTQSRPNAGWRDRSGTTAFSPPQPVSLRVAMTLTETTLASQSRARQQVGSKWLWQTVATCERFRGVESPQNTACGNVRQRVSGCSAHFASRRSPVRSRLAPLSRTACRFHVSGIARGSSRFIADQAQGASWVQQIRHRAGSAAVLGAGANSDPRQPWLLPAERRQERPLRVLAAQRHCGRCPCMAARDRVRVAPAMLLPPDSSQLEFGGGCSLNPDHLLIGSED
jgi:hypothetical protein